MVAECSDASNRDLYMSIRISAGIYVYMYNMDIICTHMYLSVTLSGPRGHASHVFKTASLVVHA